MNYVNFFGFLVIIAAMLIYIRCIIISIKRKELIKWIFSNVSYLFQTLFLVVVFIAARRILKASNFIYYKNWLCKLILLLLFYFIVVFFVKFFEYYFIYTKKQPFTEKEKEYKLKKRKKAFWDNFPIFFISPDLFFSRIFKSMVLDRDKKAKIICSFNLISFFFSVFIIVLLLFINFIKLDILSSTYIKILLIYRFISRTVEIILAFIQDITETDKSSNLKSFQRVILAFTSLFEIILLVNAIFYLTNPKFAESIMQTFSLLIDLGSSNHTYLENTIKILTNVTVFTLLGIVLSSYLNTHKTDLNVNNFPILLRYNSDGQDIVKISVFEKSSDTDFFYVIDIKVTDIYQVFEISFQGVTWSPLVSNGMLINKLIRTNKFFFNQCGEYRLRFKKTQKKSQKFDIIRL